jgi:hypothetical protein
MNIVLSRLIILALSFTLLTTLNIPSVVNSQENDTKKSMEPLTESFLTYTNENYGIRLEYPSTWYVEEPNLEYTLSILENISSSESQGIKSGSNIGISSKLSDVLEAFGLEKVSDIFGLKPDARLEVLKQISKQLNEGTLEMPVTISSPPEDELDNTTENMNIVLENISILPPISLNDYVNANIEVMKEALPQFSIIEPMKDTTVDGNPAITLVYTNNPEGIVVKVLQIFTIRGDIAYAIGFGATPGTYYSYLPVFQRMLESIELNK